MLQIRLRLTKDRNQNIMQPREIAKKTKNRIVGLCEQRIKKDKRGRERDGDGVKGHLLSCDINLNPGRFSSVHGCCSL